MAQMGSQGVETRPVFHCAHTMPMYATGETLSVAEGIAARGLSLPSFPTLTEDEILRVVDALIAALTNQGLLS
jgi:perosamine synthetase